MLWLTVAPRDLHRIGELIAAPNRTAFAAVSGAKDLMGDRASV